VSGESGRNDYPQLFLLQTLLTKVSIHSRFGSWEAEVPAPIFSPFATLSPSVQAPKAPIGSNLPATDRRSLGVRELFSGMGRCFAFAQHGMSATTSHYYKNRPAGAFIISFSGPRDEDRLSLWKGLALVAVLLKAMQYDTLQIVSKMRH
jgi:hypothetical protein